MRGGPASKVNKAGEPPGARAIPKYGLRFECKPGDFESNLTLLHAALVGCCCDLHGCASVLMVLRVAVGDARTECGLSSIEPEVRRLREKYMHLFQRDWDSSDATALALIDLLITAWSIGIGPGDRKGLPRQEVA